jgi:hypothetical protein
MTISHFITVHFITLAWWSFILAQVPISGVIGKVAATGEKRAPGLTPIID